MPPAEAIEPPTITPEELGEFTEDQWVRAKKVATGEYPAIPDPSVARLVLCIREMCEKLGIPLESLKNAVQADGMAKVAEGCHDINNALTAIQGTLYFAFDQLMTSELENCLQDIEVAAKRAQEKTKEMLRLARAADKPSKQNHDISALINSVIGCASREFLNIQIEPELDPNCFAVVDPAQIQSAIDNLIRNSAHAMPNGGTLTVRVEPISNKSVSPGYIQIIVRDTGCGISEENQKRIYDRHFTTKGKDGNGFGLGIVKRTVEAHNGSIVCESQQGEGSFTEFRIKLPSQ